MSNLFQESFIYRKGILFFVCIKKKSVLKKVYTKLAHKSVLKKEQYQWSTECQITKCKCLKIANWKNKTKPQVSLEMIVQHFKHMKHQTLLQLNEQESQTQVLANYRESSS